MAFLNWIGSADNLATNPASWSPAQVPTVADDLFMTTGTMVVVGNEIAKSEVIVGDASSLGATSATTATAHAPVVFNVQGNATINQNMLLPATQPTVPEGSITFNLVGSNAVFTGGFGSFFSDVFVHGAGTMNSEISGINGANAVIDPDVVGSGQFFVLGAGTKNGFLEFKGAVSAGQTIEVHGDTTKNTFGILQLDNPANFAGSIDLGFGEIILAGVKADSASFANDMLTVTNGTTTVASLRLHQVSDSGGAVLPLTITQGTAGVILSAHGAATDFVAPPSI